jgi:hypothetical protein
MTKRIVLLTEDINLENFVKITALTLTKLNYQVDIFKETRKDIDLVILDFDSPENIEVLKSVRQNPDLNNKKIIGVATNTTNKKIFFNLGCDSVMSKKEFESNANSILMY